MILKDIDDWLEELAETSGQETLLLEPTGTPMQDETIYDLFLQAFAHLLARFGSPDAPRDSNIDWRLVLKVHSPLFAIWDFDYYQLSLSAKLGTANLADRDGVILARHVSHPGAAETPTSGASHSAV